MSEVWKVLFFDNDVAVFARGHAVVCQNQKGALSTQGHLWEAAFDTTVVDVHFDAFGTTLLRMLTCTVGG